jgi:dipeptidase E
LYSGGGSDGNDRLHKALSSLRGKKVRSLTYIPSTHENGEYYFNRIKKRYKKYGIKKFVYFAADSDFIKSEMQKALRSDVIYLAGGNTYYFLKHIRASGLLAALQRYVRRGGILAGLSAGAIIMTPHIELAGYPPHEGDLNEVRLKNLKSLAMVEFEFLPHYTGSARTRRAMEKYSRRNQNRPIFACSDGGGVVVDGEEIRLFGPVVLYHAGRRLKIA